jgi:hypothetical protein
MLRRFLELGLVEEHVYADDGSQVLQIADWRSYRPADLTGQERKRRFSAAALRRRVLWH